MRIWIRLIKIFTLILAITLILAFFFAVTGRMPWLSFWIIAGLMALVAYVILPRVKKIIANY